MLIKYAVPDELMKKLIALGLTEGQAMEKVASGDAEEFIKTAEQRETDHYKKYGQGPKLGEEL